MSGNAQTEVITGPGTSATVLGSKTLEQFILLLQEPILQVMLHWI